MAALTRSIQQWTQAGVFGTLGGIFSDAFGINDSGQIVGMSAITGAFP